MDGNRIGDMEKAHIEFSVIAQYPPFSISLKKQRPYLEDLNKEEARIVSEWKEGNPDAFRRMFSTLEAKWQDDIDEARLYQKRFNSPTEAWEYYVKENSLDEMDRDVPLRP
jgi:hypothetical protein